MFRSCLVSSDSVFKNIYGCSCLQHALAHQSCPCWGAWLEVPAGPGLLRGCLGTEPLLSPAMLWAE